MSAERSLRLERWTQVLIVVLASGALLVLWSAFLGSNAAERNRAIDAETLRLVRTVRLFAANLDHLLGESRLAFDLLKASVAAHPDLDPMDSAEFRALVGVVRQQGQGDLDIKAVDRRGRLVTFDQDTAGILVTDRDYLKGALASASDLFLGEPIISRVSGHWVLVVSTPMAPDSGSLEALQVSLDYDTFDRLFLALTDAGEVVQVYRNDGVLLYQYPRSPDFWPQASADWAAVRDAGTESGVLGAPLRAFQKGSEAGFWVIATRSLPEASWTGETGFQVRTVWMGILTLAVLLVAAGLLVLQTRLRQLRLTQEDLARIDPLTGLLNRRAFLERCTVERMRTDRSPGPLSLVLLDLDHFKDVNDTYGHQVGDQALRDFGAALVRTLRATDVLARMGGEEFAVLLPATDGPQALEITERLRVEVEGIALPGGHLTTSIGLAVWDRAETFDSWYHRADQALYRAKTEGRNRVAGAP